MSKVFQVEEPKLPVVSIADFVVEYVNGRYVTTNRFVIDAYVGEDQSSVIVELDDGTKYRMEVSRIA